MAVVTYHVDLDFGEPRWFPSAYLAVDLFFVLSGFVLAHAYEHRFASGMTTWQFMLLRTYSTLSSLSSCPVRSLDEFAGRRSGWSRCPDQPSFRSFCAALEYIVFASPCGMAGDDTTISHKLCRMVLAIRIACKLLVRRYLALSYELSAHACDCPLRIWANSMHLLFWTAGGGLERRDTSGRSGTSTLQLPNRRSSLPYAPPSLCSAV